MTKIEVEPATPAVNVDALDVVEFYGKMLSVALNGLTDIEAIKEIQRINEEECPHSIFQIREANGKPAVLLRLAPRQPR